jgi:hypothetical protein
MVAVPDRPSPERRLRDAVRSDAILDHLEVGGEEICVPSATVLPPSSAA